MTACLQCWPTPPSSELSTRARGEAVPAFLPKAVRPSCPLKRRGRCHIQRQPSCGVRPLQTSDMGGEGHQPQPGNLQAHLPGLGVLVKHDRWQEALRVTGDPCPGVPDLHALNVPFLPRFCSRATGSWVCSSLQQNPKPVRVIPEAPAFLSESQTVGCSCYGREVWSLPAFVVFP